MKNKIETSIGNDISSTKKKEIRISNIVLGVIFIINWVIYLLSDYSRGWSDDFWPFVDGHRWAEDILLHYSLLEFSIYGTIIFIFFVIINREKIFNGQDVKIQNEPIHTKAIVLIFIFLNILTLFISNSIFHGGMYYPQYFFPFTDYPEFFKNDERNIFILLKYTYSWSEFIFYTCPLILLFILYTKSLNELFFEYLSNLKLGWKKILSLSIFLAPILFIFIFTEAIPFNTEIKKMFFEMSPSFIFYFFNYLLLLVTVFIVLIIFSKWIKKDFSNTH